MDISAPPHKGNRPPVRLAFWTTLALFLTTATIRGDGGVFKEKSYRGSLEEYSQEALIVFHTSEKDGGSFEDLILKIGVRGKTDQFAWVIPFPSEPKAEKEDARLFEELYNSVEYRLRENRFAPRTETKTDTKADETKPDHAVEVLSRRDVGSYEVAVVRENEAGALNRWLTTAGYQALPPDSEDVIGFYRQKGYVFACIKVREVTPGAGGTATLHPLRFTFQTGGFDGIYFPMKLTGLQREPFDVNLYVFYRYWLNDKVSKHGYVHRGFQLRYRDWDSPQSEPNAGKSYSAPQEDPFLRHSAYLFPTVTKLFQKLHPGERYYLTNIQAHQLKPAEVRQWSDDLWLFPFSTREGWIPHDARQGGIASAAWPHDVYEGNEDEAPAAGPGPALVEPTTSQWLEVTTATVGVGLVAIVWFWWRNRPARVAVPPGI